MKLLISTAILTVMVFLVGCGSMGTSGHLAPIKVYNQPHTKKTLTYRSIQIARDVEDALTTGAGPSNLGIEIQKSELFSSVTEYKAQSWTRYVLPIPNDKTVTDDFLKINFPVETDYFLDIQYVLKSHDSLGAEIWRGFSILSFGMLPMFKRKDFSLTAILYDKNGHCLQEVTVDNGLTLWHWTPLIFFNGFKIKVSSEELEHPVIGSSLDHALFDLQM